MRIEMLAAVACCAVAAGCAPMTTANQPAASTVDRATLAKQVADTERAFAKTMADRNHAAFTTFLSDEAVFFTSTTALRGKQAVADFWKRFYEKREAPFSWEPAMVEVLDSGTLALSTGPVRDPSGKHFLNFTSIWRQEAPGVWKIVFDKGNEQCDCGKP